MKADFAMKGSDRQRALNLQVKLLPFPVGQNLSASSTQDPFMLEETALGAQAYKMGIASDSYCQ